MLVRRAMESHMKILTLFLLLSATACGDSLTIDTLDEVPPITLTVKYPPLLVAYRDAAESEWKQADIINSTTVQFPAKGPYVLTVVCRTDQHIWVQ